MTTTDSVAVYTQGCPICMGTGRVDVGYSPWQQLREQRCYTCRGSGVITITKPKGDRNV